MSRTCIVCPHHISSQPRSLREADTLAKEGHEVVVVSRQTDPARSLEDRRLAETRPWELRSVVLHRSGPTRGRWFATAARSEVARRLLRAGMKSAGVAVASAVRGASALTQLALDWPADLYIGHTQLGLPIAALAAEAHGARLGFDCEDLLADSGTDDPRTIHSIEAEFIGRCDYVTTASQAMADRLETRYRVAADVLYNVFPLRLRGDMPPPSERPQDGALRIHWFGQTLGPGRGLEEAVRAVGEIGEGVELHFRGRVSSDFRQQLECIGGENAALFFHEPLPHDDLIRAFERYHVGLALERPTHPNYGVTVTNKLFSYALGGLAVLATDTEGQREALSKMPGAGTLVPELRSGALVEPLVSWRDDRDALAAAQTAAWQRADRRFCWDVEQERFLTLVQPSVDHAVGRDDAPRRRKVG
ncbi:MAG: glycosyltransferase [Gemmatimonadota bacterium]|nr:glycosyltransferase [Gemmatimonadota bacterium]